MLSGDGFILQPQKLVDRYLFKYFFDFKVTFPWMSDALTVSAIANFDHFKDQNTHFPHMSTVFMLSCDIFIP